jgi:hypothetical protein
MGEWSLRLASLPANSRLTSLIWLVLRLLGIILQLREVIEVLYGKSFPVNIP